MTSSADKTPPEQAELLVLRAMCQGTPQGSVRAEAARALSRYAWREPFHQALFSCLGIIAAVEPDDLRHTLLACLTRKGFPDVDLKTFFEPHHVARQEASVLIQLLADSR